MPDPTSYEEQADIAWQRRQAAAAREEAENAAAWQAAYGTQQAQPPPTPVPIQRPGASPVSPGGDVLSPPGGEGFAELNPDFGKPWQDATKATYRIDPVTGKRQLMYGGGATGGQWQDIPEGQVPDFEARLQAQNYDARKDPTVTSITQPPPKDSGTGSSVPVPPAAGTGTGASNTPAPAQATSSATPPAQTPFNFASMSEADRNSLFQQFQTWRQGQRQAQMGAQPGMETPPVPQGPVYNPVTDPTTGSIITSDHPGYQQLRQTLGMPESDTPAVSPQAYKYSRFPSLSQGRGWGRGGRQMGQGIGPGMQQGFNGPGTEGQGQPGMGRRGWGQNNMSGPLWQSPNKSPSGLFNDPRAQLQDLQQKPMSPSQNPYTGFAKSPWQQPTPKPQEQPTTNV